MQFKIKKKEQVRLSYLFLFLCMIPKQMAPVCSWSKEWYHSVRYPEQIDFQNDTILQTGQARSKIVLIPKQLPALTSRTLI